MNLQSDSERISDEIAHYVGPNWRDYRPVSEMVTEYVHRFGTVAIDDVPEIKWVRFLTDMLRESAREEVDVIAFITNGEFHGKGFIS